jgi:hypothetical protein
MWHFFNTFVCVSSPLSVVTWKESLCSYCSGNEIPVISEHTYVMKNILTVNTLKLTTMFFSPFANMTQWITFSFFEKFPSDIIFYNLIQVYKSCVIRSPFLSFLFLLLSIFGNMFHNISLLPAIVNVCLSICHLLSCVNLLQNILLNEYKTITTTSGKTDTLVSWNIPC